jgi:hypothetical protein
MHLQRPLTAGAAASPSAAGATGSRSTVAAADTTSAADTNDTVAQTFDDGPDPGTTSTFRIRRANGVRATRFGRQTEVAHFGRQTEVAQRGRQSAANRRQTAANRGPVAAGVPIVNSAPTAAQAVTGTAAASSAAVVARAAAGAPARGCSYTHPHMLHPSSAPIHGTPPLPAPRSRGWPSAGRAAPSTPAGSRRSRAGR